MGHKRSSLSMKSYADGAAYARDLHAGGGPSLADLDSLPLHGQYAELLRAIWGANSKDFGAAMDYDLTQLQQGRRHIFVRKWRR